VLTPDDIGRRIRELRQKHKLSLRALALGKTMAFQSDKFYGRDQIQQVILANAQLQVVVAPAIGGRVVSAEWEGDTLSLHGRLPRYGLYVRPFTTGLAWLSACMVVDA